MKKYLVTIPAVIILTLLAAALIFVTVWQKRQLAKIRELHSDPLAYSQIMTPADQKPLEVPKASIDSGRAVHVPILMYHHVGDYPPNASKTRKDLTVSASDFARQVKWLSDHGYHSIRLEDLYLLSQHKFILPDKPVIFTFDDGYDDVFRNALPILQQYHYLGSLAIITTYPKTEQLDQQADNFYASWEEIARAFSAGHEIVSHTQDHFDGTNPKYKPDFIFNNLSQSIQDIQNHLGFSTNVLIYPYGHYNPAYIEQAKKAGFVMGITVHDGKTVNLDNLMELPRVRIHGGETLERFIRQIDPPATKIETGVKTD